MKNKEEYNSYMREYNKRRYWKLKAEAHERLGGKCAECGSTEGLELDHIDPSTKTVEVSRFCSMSRVRFLEELKLCQLLCNEHHKQKSIQEQSVEHGGGLSGKKNCPCELCKARKSEYMRNWYKKNKQASLAQWSELCPLKSDVLGSNPRWGTRR